MNSVPFLRQERLTSGGGCGSRAAAPGAGMPSAGAARRRNVFIARATRFGAFMRLFLQRRSPAGLPLYELALSPSAALLKAV